MAHGRHRRLTRRPSFLTGLPAPFAVVPTVLVIALGVATGDALTSGVRATSAGIGPSATATADVGPWLSDRKPTVSRAALRRESARRQRALEAEQDRLATARAIRRADTQLWTTTALNLWSGATPEARQVGLLARSTRVLVTGRATSRRAEVVWQGKARWVTRGYLSRERPARRDVTTARAGATASTAGCTNGTTVPSGVSPHIVVIHAAVCAAFPEVTTYGTFRGGGGDHGSGLAVDIMTSGARGWQIAEFVRQRFAAFGVNYVIYAQHIWSVTRSAEGWRAMADRGSTTANHYDHVHVSVY